MSGINCEGLQIVEKQLKDRTVRTGEEELFKARAKETGSVRLIDIVRARLDAKNDCYLAELPSLALRDVRIDDQLVRDNERMLTDGFYAEVTLTYDGIIAQQQGGRPFKADALRPIQMSKSDALDVLTKARQAFSVAEWIDFLMRSIGLEPAALELIAPREVSFSCGWCRSSSETTTWSNSALVEPERATYSSRSLRIRT